MQRSKQTQSALRTYRKTRKLGGVHPNHFTGTASAGGVGVGTGVGTGFENFPATALKAV